MGPDLWTPGEKINEPEKLFMSWGAGRVRKIEGIK